MISIDSVNILISLHPRMHSELPHPTPTKWALFSFFFLQQIPTLQTIFSRALFRRWNGFDSKRLASKGLLWKALEMGEIWLSDTRPQLQSRFLYNVGLYYSLTSAAVPDSKVVYKVIPNLWNSCLFLKSIGKRNYFFLPINRQLLHYLPTTVAGNFLHPSEIFHTR